jgi:Kef-type K+ transport system membrane component KefB
VTGAAPFAEIAALVLLAAALGFAGLVLRQPLVVAFIAVGVLAGPDALGLVDSSAFVETLSQISIAVLLFLVGLKLDLSLVRSLGRVAVAAGVGQVTLTAAAGAALCLLLGFGVVTALYVGAALSFSSTIVIVKLLSDKAELSALHGKIALGILIVQDLVVVLGMAALSALAPGAAADGASGHAGAPGIGALPILGGVGLLVGVLLFIRYLADPLVARVARSPELLVIFATGWAAGLAAVADGVGLGKEIGGLLAGVSLASTAYRDAISSRLAPLRDFLLLFFFIDLGAGLDLRALGAAVGPAAVLSLFVLVGKPLLVLALLVRLGYGVRTAALAGMTLGQISEFSLIFIGLGAGLDHLDEAAEGVVTLVGLVTIALSVYVVTWSQTLFARLEPWLAPLDRRDPFREADALGHRAEGRAHDFVLFGLGRYGSRIGQDLSNRGHRVLGVDFDPEAVASWRARGLDAVFGDATDPEFAAHLNLDGTQAVIAAVPRERGPLTSADPQIALVHGLRSAGFRGRIVLSASHADDAARLRGLGADLVLSPFDDAASFAVEQLVPRGPGATTR